MVGAMTAEPSLQRRFGLTVTPQNVLGVRAVVLQEAQDLHDMLKSESEQVILPKLGWDPVSRDMAAAFNPLTQQLLDRAKRHIETLKDLGNELAASAREYGHAESEIRSSFAPGAGLTAASQLSPTFLHAAGMGVIGDKRSPTTVGEILLGGSN